jgi:hypothetical protein
VHPTGRLPGSRPTGVLDVTTRAPRLTASIAAERVKTVEIVAELVCVWTMRRFVIALSACALPWACGDNHPGAPDVDPDGGPFQPAPHAPMPQVIPHTRTVLSTLQLVTITFDGYSAGDDVEAFGDVLVGSRWYTTIGAEYGMSAGTHARKVRIGTPPASLDRAQIATKIIDLIGRGDLPRPEPDHNQLLYLLYVPPTVARGPDLRSVSGYHEMLAIDDARFPIAVVLDDGHGLAATTTTAAHQLIDAVTNPYEPPKDGYYTDPPKTDPWSLVRGEVADLCEGEAQYAELGHVFPRVYSSTAAQDSLPPCLPVMPGDTWSDVTAKPAQIQSIPPGGTVRFKLTGWSTIEMSAWKLRIQAADSSHFSEDEMLPQLSSDTINNNTTVTLTLHAPPDAPDGAVGGVYILSGANNHPWAVGFMVSGPQ